MGYIGAAEDHASPEGFNDKELIADYAADAMASMVAAGIIKGTDNGGEIIKTAPKQKELSLLLFSGQPLRIYLDL